MQVEIENIPAEMISDPRWILWELTSDGRKVPRKAVTGDSLPFAKANDQSTWTDFETALLAHEFWSKRGRNVGMGFCLQGDWSGIDLDGCYGEDGQMLDWAKPIVERLEGVGYAEVSPSGRGIKIFLQAFKPGGFTTTTSFGEGRAIEVHGDSPRYYAVTGQSLWCEMDSEDQQPAMDGICADHLGRRDSKSTRRPLGGSRIDGGGGVRLSSQDLLRVDYAASESLSDDPVERYAIGIMNSGEVIGSGQRNNRMFQIAGHLAKKTTNEFRRLAILRKINAVMVDPPLDDFEVRQLAESSIVNGDPPVDSPYAEYIKEFDEGYESANITSFVNNCKRRSKWHLSKEYFKVPGLIGEIYDNYLETAKDVLPEIAFVTALNVVSTVTSGKVMFEGSNPNIFSIGLAPSGAGKEFGRKLTKKILEESGFGDRNGPDGISSAEGYIRWLSENNVSLFQLDEAAEMIGQLDKSPFAAKIGKVLKESYSSSGTWRPVSRSDSKLNVEVREPLPILYMTTTPTLFWSSFSPNSVEDGLLGRLLIFETEYSQERGRRYRQPSPTDKIISMCRAWHDARGDGNLSPEHFPENRLQWTQSDGAASEFGEFDAEVMDRLSDANTALWKRSYDKIYKLSLLFAASRLGPVENGVIERCDVKRAIEIVKRLTYRTIHHVEDDLVHNEADRYRQKILATVRRFGGPYPRRKLSNNVRGSRQMRDHALRDLLDSGKIELIVVNGQDCLVIGDEDEK